MQYFRDKTGKQWEIDIEYGTVKRIKALCGVDILDLVALDEKSGELKGDLLDRLITDPILLIDVLYATCKPQVDNNNMTDEDFGRGFTGEEIEGATKALINGVIDFFQEPKRTILRKMVGAVVRFMDKEKQEVMTKLQTVDLDKEMDLLLEKSNAQSSNTQDSVV